MSIAKIHSIANQITDEYTRRAVELLIDLMFSGDVGLDGDGKSAIGTGKVVEGKIGPGAVTQANLAAGTDMAALFTAGLGNTEAYPKTTDGVQEFMDKNATKVRACLFIVRVTETFAAGGGSAPTFKLGEEDDDDAFMAVKNTGTAGDVLVIGGQNTADKKIIVTAAEATDTGTGAIEVTALVLTNA